MDELVAFWNLRLCELEDAAKEAAEGPGDIWTAGDGGEDRERDGVLYDRDRLHVLGWFDDHREAAEHAARNDPKSVLADVAADRRLMQIWDNSPKAWRDAPAGINPVMIAENNKEAEVLEEVIKVRAGRFADHPAYQEKWKP
jgi:hypothetical protein